MLIWGAVRSSEQRLLLRWSRASVAGKAARASGGCRHVWTQGRFQSPQAPPQPRGAEIKAREKAAHWGPGAGAVLQERHRTCPMSLLNAKQPPRGSRPPALDTRCRWGNTEPRARAAAAGQGSGGPDRSTGTARHPGCQRGDFPQSAPVQRGRDSNSEAHHWG